MAVQAWTDVAIWIDDIEASVYGKSFSLNVDVAELDTTPLSTTGWVSRIGGLKTTTFDMDVMQDVAVDSVDDTLYPLLGTSNTVKSVAVGSTTGSAAYLSRGVILNYAPIQDGAVGSLAMGRLSAKTSGHLVRGVLGLPSAARSSSSTGTAYQVGALSSSQTLFAALHVTAITGSPTLDVKIQSDTVGFGSATDRITFSQATGKGAQWGSVAGAVTDDYWRAQWTFGGTGSITFAVTFGRATT